MAYVYPQFYITADSGHLGDLQSSDTGKEPQFPMHLTAKILQPQADTSGKYTQKAPLEK